jgi:isoleucyl-tRNA synthetase
MDYSKTVNLPKTDFSMKANLANKEPERLKEWEKNNIYNQILKARQGKDSFILHDGPPYANGNIHIGHALNKILKDIIIKHKTMKGFKTPYVPGWDCHGLPIELNVTKKLGSKAKEMDPLTIRSECRKYAQKYIDLQREEFKRLGVFGDFSHPYLTMSKDYEAKIIETFGKIFAKGFISRQKKPIYWCPTCATALAEAEVEYDDHSSPSIYVKFKIDPKSFDLPELDSKDSYAIIWTTTPWTLPANLGVCFHPQFKYSFFKFKNDFYLLADDLLANLEKILGETSQEKISFPNEKIKNLKVYHPFIDRESKILFARHVTLEQGTGIVHTAPGHGLEDYIVGLEYDLDPYCPVNQYGCFTKDYSEMEGVNVFKANPLVVDLLKNKKALLSVQEIEHSYPHCWRCKRPLIFRATEQWFLKIDFNNLRAEGLKSINETNWIPAWGETRIKSMAEISS